jgi:hypothetical protein
MKYCHCIYGLSVNVPKKFRKTPSNASNFPKGFRHVRFRTSSMSIFWKFFESCAKSNSKYNKLIYIIICKKEEHNGLNNQWCKK